MPKETLKRTLRKKQNGTDVLTQQGLHTDPSLMDTHRKTPKAKGGVYTIENTIITAPIAHMIEHGNLRIRTARLNSLKTLIDHHQHALKLNNKVNNQLLAFKRQTDDLDKDTFTMLTEAADKFQTEANKVKRKIEKEIKEIVKVDPLARAAMGVNSVGPVTVAYCLVYIDLEKARHASALWSYAGLHKASHERYTKTVAGGGNKRLRTALYNMATSQIKGKDAAYRGVYDNVKNRLAKSEKITKSRNTQGALIECAWKDTKACHRNGAAIRAIMKHFLADYWRVGRELMGLPVDALYPEAILGGNHRTIMPDERGWKW